MKNKQHKEIKKHGESPRKHTGSARTGAAGENRVFCLILSESSCEASGDFSVPTVQVTGKHGPRKYHSVFLKRTILTTVGPAYLWVPHPQIQPTSKFLRKKSYIFADVFYVVRPMMAVSV